MEFGLGMGGQFVIAVQQPENCQSCLNEEEATKKSNAYKHLLGIVFQLLPWI